MILPKHVWGGGPTEGRWSGILAVDCPSTMLRMAPLPEQSSGRIV
jgi:hypothetical protein